MIKLINVDPSEIDDPLVQELIRVVKERNQYLGEFSDDQIVLRRRENNANPYEIVCYIEGVSNVQDIDWNEPPKGLVL